MCDLEHAKKKFSAGGYTCVLCKEGHLLTHTKRGIVPMVQWLSDGIILDGYVAVDKIVGKAAALLFALAGISAIYAEVLSESALSVLHRYQIEVHYNTLVPQIINRTKMGMCPMEQAVADIDDPVEAFAAIVKTLDTLNVNKG